MSKIDRLLEEEGAAAEAHEPPDPLPDHVTVSRPGRSRASVVSVRVTDAELVRLQAAARQAGIPLSTLMRVWALDRLEAEEQGTGGDIGARLARLEREVFHKSA